MYLLKFRKIKLAKKEWLPLNGIHSIKKNGFHAKEWIPLKRAASTQMSGFQLKSMTSTQINGLY